MEMIITSTIMPMSMSHHMVGVHFFPACSSENSTAFHMSHSLLIFFPSPSLVNSRIPHGMINSVSIAVIIKLASIKIRLDMERKLGSRNIKNPTDYSRIFIFAN